MPRPPQCDRPGCLQCKGCGGGEGCVGGTVCLSPCKNGFGWHANACVKCAAAIPGCGRCRRCSWGANCHVDRGLECICCKEPGLRFNSTSGPRICVRESDLTVPELEAEEPYTPKIPVLSTLIDPAVPQQPQQPATPVVPPVVTPPQPVVPTTPVAPPRDPALDQCQPLATPAPVAPTVADAAASGLTEPPMMAYGTPSIPGAQADRCGPAGMRESGLLGRPPRWHLVRAGPGPRLAAPACC